MPSCTDKLVYAPTQSDPVKITLGHLKEIYLSIKCQIIRDVVDSYLSRYSRSLDSDLIELHQSDLSRIAECTPEQQAIIGKYVKLPEAETYSIGQYFIGKYTKDIYMLARIGGNDDVALIDIIHGNRWASAITVSNMKNITKQEFNKISDEATFKKVQVHIEQV